jgi:hypothetical protein
MTGEFRQKIRDILKRRYRYYDPACHGEAASEIAEVCMEAINRVDKCMPRPEKPRLVTLKGTNVSITIRTDQIVGVKLWWDTGHGFPSVVVRLADKNSEQIMYDTAPEAQVAYRTVKEALE